MFLSFYLEFGDLGFLASTLGGIALKLVFGMKVHLLSSVSIGMPFWPNLRIWFFSFGDKVYKRE